MKPIKKTVANFELPVSLKKRAEARARKEDISFSALQRKLIRDYLKDSTGSK